MVWETRSIILTEGLQWPIMYVCMYVWILFWWFTFVAGILNKWSKCPIIRLVTKRRILYLGVRYLSQISFYCNFPIKVLITLNPLGIRRVFASLYHPVSSRHFSKQSEWSYKIRYEEQHVVALGLLVMGFRRKQRCLLDASTFSVHKFIENGNKKTGMYSFTHR